MTTNLPSPFLPPSDPGLSPGPEAPPDTAAVAGGRLPAEPTRSLFRRGLDVFTENRLAVAGVVVVGIFVLFCFAGPLLYHTDQIHTSLSTANQPPGGKHLLGTDQDGFDELGRLMVGGRSSIEVGLAAAVLATVLGTLWGAVSGYAGGIVDTIMMRVVDAALAVPPLFLLLVLAAMFTPTVPVLVLVVALVSWLVTARLVRGEALSLRVREYVQAVRVMGGRGPRIVLRHIAPNAMGTIMVNATFQVADAILLVASLSYLGLGVPPPSIDWGGMLSHGTQYVYVGYWWLIYPPGLAIILIVVAFNFIGDALRDAFEVRLQRR
jgi:peptide/nickel transport system permease protein